MVNLKLLGSKINIFVNCTNCTNCEAYRKVYICKLSSTGNPKDIHMCNITWNMGEMEIRMNWKLKYIEKNSYIFVLRYEDKIYKLPKWENAPHKYMTTSAVANNCGIIWNCLSERILGHFPFEWAVSKNKLVHTVPSALYTLHVGVWSPSTWKKNYVRL